MTPNPEQIVQAQEDEGFRKILNSADLALPDGWGLRLAGVKTRVTGIELMEALMKTGGKFMLAGGKRGWPDLAKINKARPDYLFVGLGAPKQEKWIYHNLPKMPSVKLAMGVGGAFDYISGRVKRAPRFMRSLGLEWLYRLIRQPWRFPRIVTAVLKFGWRILKMKKNDEV